MRLVIFGINTFAAILNLSLVAINSSSPWAPWQLILGSVNAALAVVYGVLLARGDS